MRRSPSARGNPIPLRTLLPLLAAALSLLAIPPAPAPAQEVSTQPTPFTAWIDVRAEHDGTPRTWPIWLESVEIDSALTDESAAAETVFRLRCLRTAAPHRDLFLRVYFHDRAPAVPHVTVWTEIGDLLHQSDPTPSDQTGLATFHTFIVPTQNADYIEVIVPGDGSNVRGFLAASMAPALVKRATDFPLAADTVDPFGSTAGTRSARDDVTLFGRVKAPLVQETILLSSDNPAVAIEFDLETVPALAMLTLEVLDADLAAPPIASVNNRPLGTVSLATPDLADPAYVGRSKPAEPMGFYYAGWMTASQIIPARALVAGTNRLVVQLPQTGAPAAIRAVELQLKYLSDTFDFELQPLRP